MSKGRAITRRALAGGFTMILLAAVAWLGQIPLGKPSEAAGLRLSLRTVHGQIEICHDRTEAELAALPQHMRTPSVCTDHTPQYRLEVAINGRNVIDDEVTPGGWRGDRPLIVDHRLEVDPGKASLRVLFAPLADSSLAADQQAALEQLPRYELERDVVFVADRVTLVTLDDDGRLNLVDG